MISGSVARSLAGPAARGLGGLRNSGAVPPTWAFLQGTTYAADGAEQTLAGQSLGETADDRLIVVCVHGRSSAVITATGLTVAGVTASKIIEHTGGTGPTSTTSIFVAAVPSGTSGDIVVTFDNTSVRGGIQVYRATGLSATAIYTNVLSPEETINVPANAVVVSSANVTSGSGASWAGITKDHEATVETISISSASQLFTQASPGLAVDDIWNSGGTNVRCTAMFGAA